MEVERGNQFSSNDRPQVGKALAMGKGDGEESSYSKNSTLQASTSESLLTDLSDALEKATLLPAEGVGAGGPVAVVDLGSSSGPNTIGSLAFIVDKLRQRLPKDAEFQAYFNDLPSNDFNNLFQLLSNDSRAENFFAAGVPGSFVNRLFPQSSIHVFYSSLSLHWLSKLPAAVLHKDSPAYNKGGIWIVHSRSAVANAYQQQSAQDLKGFLLARGAELVSGGLLFTVFSARGDSEPNEPLVGHTAYEIQVDMEGIWSDLVAEGILTEEQRDTFNIPYYFRSIEEVREALASCDHLFHVLTLKMAKVEQNLTKLFAASGAADLSKKMLSLHKAWLNPLLEAHVGEEKSKVVWQRYEKLVENRLRTNLKDPIIEFPVCVVGLIRK